MTTILVIEDENGIRENVVEILEFEGLETLAAPDGQTGIELASKYLPDLILCDIIMPGTDGYQVLMALRDNPTTALIPFVFLTAKSDRPSVRRGMELGADDYITKPFATSDLVAAVRTRLEKHQTMSQRYAKVMEDLRGNIFQMLPHELRTPLVSILGYSELMMWDADTLLPQRVSEMAERIFMSAKRLHHLIENFLIYAQIELAASDPDRQSILPSQYVNRPDKLTTQVAYSVAEQVDRETDLQITVSEAQVVKITLESLRKIIEEVIDNAFKFSETGTLVSVTAAAVDHTYQWTIRNEGRGMTPDQIANIGAGIQFERRLFEQQGAGLGLVIAQKLAAVYGGALAIESEPGVQTTVKITVPLAR